MTNEMCFYRIGSTTIVDTAVLTQNGIYKGSYSNKTLEELRRWSHDYTSAELVELGAAIEYIKQAVILKYGHAPRKITEDQYMYALEELPPLHYTTIDNITTFKCREFACCNLTNIYAYIDNEYYVMCDDAALTHIEIIKKVIE